AGDHERAASFARAAAGSLGDGTAAGAAALVWERLGRYLWDAGASEDALVAYERAVELVGDDRETQVAARVLGAQASALMLAGRYAESHQPAEEALARVQAMGLARFHGAALQAMIVNTLFRLGRWDEGDRRAREAFDANPAGTAAMDLHLARAKISMSRGDFATAAADLEAVKALSARAIDPRFVVPVLTLEAGLAIWEERLDDARDAIAAGLARLTVRQEGGFAAALAWPGRPAQDYRAESAG